MPAMPEPASPPINTLPGYNNLQKHQPEGLRDSNPPSRECPGTPPILPEYPGTQLAEGLIPEFLSPLAPKTRKEATKSGDPINIL